MTKDHTRRQSSLTSPDSYDLHKDSLPSRTVGVIKDRLNKVGFREENAYLNWKQPYENCCSCFLIFRDYPFFIANGKGIRKEYALAGAYAEFIERLQCRGGFHFGRLGLMETDLEPPLPRRDRERDELYDRYPSLFESMDSRLYPLLPKELSTLPTCDIFNRSIAELPLSLMYTATGTTGMCAGNSFEEACVQGLCEIMERHVFRRFFTGEITGFPTVDIRKIRLRSHLVRHLLAEITDSGCDITVKDCTLGGMFPVLGAIIRDISTGFVAAAFGSDPIFDIALQRCLSEALQGRNRPDLDPGQADTAGDKPDSVYNAPYLMAVRLLSKNGEADLENAFLARPASNREYLRYLLRRIRPAGGAVFIRDFSLLGFPSYYVYAEKLSPVNPDLLLDAQLGGEIDRILEVIFNLPLAGRGRIKECAELLSGYLERHQSSFLLKLARLFGRVPIFSWLDPRWLLAFMLIESEEYGKSAAVLERALPGFAGEAIVPEPPAAEILSRYCRLKARGKGDRETGRRLRAEFGKTRYGEFLEELVKKNYADFVRRDKRGDKFAGLPIPRCRDRNSCRSCPVRDGCFQARWRELRAAFRREARTIDQRGVLRATAGLV